MTGVSVVVMPLSMPEPERVASLEQGAVGFRPLRHAFSGED